MKTTNYNNEAELCYCLALPCFKALMEIQERLTLLHRIQENLESHLNSDHENDFQFHEELSESLYYGIPIIQNEVEELIDIINAKYRFLNDPF